MHFRAFSIFLFLWVKMKSFILGHDHMVEKIVCKVLREHRGLTSESLVQLEKIFSLPMVVGNHRIGTSL